MTPSWSHQTHSIVFRPKRVLSVWSWGRCWWLGGIDPRFLAFRILKIDVLFSIVTSRWNDFLFCLASRIWHVFWRRSICLSFSSCDIYFPIFWTFPMARSCMEMAAWETSNCSASIFAIGYRPCPKKQLTVLNLPGPIFTLLVTQVKIVVIEPAKSISARCFRKHCRHRPPSIRCDSAVDFIKLKQKSKASHICFFLAKN